VMQNDDGNHLQCTVFDPNNPYTFQEAVDTSFWYRFYRGGEFPASETSVGET
jgi:hypothetical protein